MPIVSVDIPSGEHALVSLQPRLAAHLFACAYKDTPKALVLADSARLRPTVCVCACSDWCLAGWDVNDGNAAGVGPHATFGIPQYMHVVSCVCVCLFTQIDHAGVMPDMLVSLTGVRVPASASLPLYL